MEHSYIRFPVTCPRCGQESLIECRAVIVSIALHECRGMRLYATCHDVHWDASAVELEQIREYFGASGIGANHTVQAAGPIPAKQIER